MIPKIVQLFTIFVVLLTFLICKTTLWYVAFYTTLYMKFISSIITVDKYTNFVTNISLKIKIAADTNVVPAAI